MRVAAVVAAGALFACALSTACEDLSGLRNGDDADAATDGGAEASSIDEGGGTDAGANADAAACDPGPFASDLVAYWPFDDGAGTTVKSCSSPALAGNVVDPGFGGSVQWTVGRKGGALAYDGATTCVVVGDAPELRFTGAFTVSAWVNMTSFPTSGNSSFIAVRATNVNDDGWRFAAIEGEAFALKIGLPPNADFFGIFTPSQPVGVWKHAVAVYEPNTRSQLFVDGVPMATATTDVPPAVTVTDTDLRIGCGELSVSALHASLDELRIYKRALAPAEVQQLFAF